MSIETQVSPVVFRTNRRALNPDMQFRDAQHQLWYVVARPGCRTPVSQIRDEALRVYGVSLLEKDIEDECTRQRGVCKANSVKGNDRRREIYKDGGKVAAKPKRRKKGLKIANSVKATKKDESVKADTDLTKKSRAILEGDRAPMFSKKVNTVENSLIGLAVLTGSFYTLRGLLNGLIARRRVI